MNDCEAALAAPPAHVAETLSSSSSTPPYVRWALQMRNLLADGEGVRLFKQFLDQEADGGSSAPLDFWFACQGFKNNVRVEETHKIYQLIKVIYRTYVRGGVDRAPVVSVQQETRRRISDKLTSKTCLDQSIFDEAQQEVEEFLRNSSYPAFLKSDLFVQYVADGGGTGTSARNSYCGGELNTDGLVVEVVPATTAASISCMIHLDSDWLPTVQEDCELDVTSSSSCNVAPCVAASNCTSGSGRRSASPNISSIGIGHNTVSASISSTTLVNNAVPALTRRNLKMTRRERAGSPAGRRFHHHNAAKSSSNAFFCNQSPPTAVSNGNAASTAGVVAATGTGVLIESAAAAGAGISSSSSVASTLSTSIRRLPNPYHVSYAPVSAQDSELQSLSSDALTDDTMSLTDSSLDGTVTGHGPHARRKQWRQQHRSIRQSAQQNREDIVGGYEGALAIIPRTEQIAPPKQSSLAEHNPKEFASILTDKLNLVVLDRLNIQKMDKMLVEMESDIPKTSTTSSTSARDLAVLRAPWAGRLLAAAQATQAQDAQEILEDHCGRIWEKSADATPAEGRARSPDVSSAAVGMAVRRSSRRTSAAAAAAAVASSLSLVSQDSGVVDGSSDRRYVHHYHYHHHYQQRNAANAVVNSTAVENNSEKLAATTSASINKESLMITNLSNSNHKAKGPPSDVSSNVDSGVSMVYDKIKSPTSSKVLAWMSASYGSEHPHQRSTGGSGFSQHKRSTNNSKTSAAASQLGLQGYVAAAALDSSVMAPRQPAMADPGMEPLGTPHTTVQLEEAKRRLQAMTQSQVRSSSTLNGVSREASLSNTSTLSKGSNNAPFPKGKRSPAPTVIGSGNTETSNSCTSDSVEVNSTNTTTTTTTTTTSLPCIITVGYYLCGDPVPYRSTWQGRDITLGQFKQLVAKKGSYKYFFKKACNDFESGVVHEEICRDEDLLPLWEGKVVGKIERLD